VALCGYSPECVEHSSFASLRKDLGMIRSALSKIL